MATQDKPIHDMCVDKTSCRHEVSLDKDGNLAEIKERSEIPPTEQLTKDFIRKQFEESQKQSGK